jgi:zinc D-Ala-D-Ala carboxypeptidase
MPMSAAPRPRMPAALAAALAVIAALALAASPARAAAPSPLNAPSAPSAPSAPACRFADVVAQHAGYDDWATTIVDTEVRLPSGYAPPDLVTVGRAGLAGSARVRALVVDDLAAMAMAAADADAPLAVISAYRSEAEQRSVFAGWVRQVGEDAARLASARPGHSEHELGTTIDFTTPDLTGPWANNFGASPQGQWLHGHAAAFGFVESYPAASSPKTTCYQAEPWHYRYVGRAEAARVTAARVPLRAYLYGLPSEAAGSEGASPAAGAAGTHGASAARPTPASPPQTDASPATATGPVPRPALDGGLAPVFIAGLAAGFGIDWVRVLVRARRRRAAREAGWRRGGGPRPR